MTTLGNTEISAPSSSSPILTFDNLRDHLPPELVLAVLRAWTGPQRLVVRDDELGQHDVLWACKTDFRAGITLSRYLYAEYKRYRQLSWYTSVKDFTDPEDYYKSHYLLSQIPTPAFPAPYTELPSNIWRTTNMQDLMINIDTYIATPHPLVPLHGLENIRLDFSADAYFAMFKIDIPPFIYADPESMDNDLIHDDKFAYGTATFLAQTQSLTLHFGSAFKYSHPWLNLMSPQWEDAKWRPDVCVSGLLVDWILEFAWDGGYLQQIPEIKIMGDVQAWVREKWYNIFERQREWISEHEGEDGKFEVHTPDVEAIRTFGKIEEEDEEKGQHEQEQGDDDDEFEVDDEGILAGEGVNDSISFGGDEPENARPVWAPEDHFPPKCTCAISCSRLQGGGVLDEIVPEHQNWEEMEQDPPAIPAEDWDAFREQVAYGVW